MIESLMIKRSDLIKDILIKNIQVVYVVLLI